VVLDKLRTAGIAGVPLAIERFELHHSGSNAPCSLSGYKIMNESNRDVKPLPGATLKSRRRFSYHELSTRFDSGVHFVSMTFPPK